MALFACYIAIPVFFYFVGMTRKIIIIICRAYSFLTFFFLAVPQLILSIVKTGERERAAGVERHTQVAKEKKKRNK